MASLHSYLDTDNSEATMNGLEESKEQDGGHLIVRHYCTLVSDRLKG